MSLKWLTSELINFAFSNIKIPGVLSSPPLEGMTVHCCRINPDSLQSASSLRNRQSFIKCECKTAGYGGRGWDKTFPHVHTVSLSCPSPRVESGGGGEGGREGGREGTPTHSLVLSQSTLIIRTLLYTPCLSCTVRVKCFV